MKQKLLTRDQFREGVFARDNYLCVACKNEGQDAHHIIERRLFENGGYFLDNGATLCGKCHILAEQTIISAREIREFCQIQKRILPDHLYEDYEYDKWGNIENSNGTRVKGELFNDESVQKILAQGGVLDRFSNYIKYPRTYHLSISPGRTDDDKSLPDCSIFEGKHVTITEKMDGENTTFYWDGYSHARSLDSGNHPSRNWVKNRMASVVYDLPKGWRICGENLYAKHAIKYEELKDLFLVFSIWDENNTCLSWEDTKEWCDLLGLNTVPVFYENQTWFESLDTLTEKLIDPDQLDRKDKCEGFVIRNADSFSYGNFRRNVGKYVRANHIQENKHWIKTEIVKNGIIS